MAALAGCAHGGGEAASWEGPPTRAEDGELAVEAFNDYVDESDDAWTRSPVATAATFLALGEQQSRATTVRVEFPGESRDQAAVSAEVDGVADDSIRGYRYVLRVVAATGGKWRIANARWTQRCWPGRGHQSFTTEPCL